ncbi:MAG TPA: hypothetical protein VHG72_19280 [Polyangia bacterium]|nr:hypothetical protein [Polyangia bacterium]
MTEQIREYELRDGSIVVEQDRASRNGVATEFAMETVVFAAEPPAGSFSQFFGSEEGLALSSRAPQPPLAISLPVFERPREVLDLDELAEKS